MTLCFSTMCGYSRKYLVFIQSEDLESSMICMAVILPFGER
jgi:hypothetical protein